MKKLVLFTVLLALASSAFALPTATEDFSSDPGWAEKSNRIGDTVGFHPKRSTYGYGGEGPSFPQYGISAGGLMNRGHTAYGNSYYAATGWGTLTLNDVFSVSGTYDHVNTYTNGNAHPGMDGKVHVGYCNKAALDGDVTQEEWYNNGITLSFAGWDRIGIVAFGNWVQIGGWSNDGYSPATDPYYAGINGSTFTLSYDPAAGAYGRVTATWTNGDVGGGTFNGSYDLTEAQRLSGATFDLMGFGTRGNSSTTDDQRSQGYFDNFAYTVPEPATMMLLGIGSIALIRKRK